MRYLETARYTQEMENKDGISESFICQKSGAGRGIGCGCTDNKLVAVADEPRIGNLEDEKDVKSIKSG